MNVEELIRELQYLNPTSHIYVVTLFDDESDHLFLASGKDITLRDLNMDEELNKGIMSAMQIGMDTSLACWAHAVHHVDASASSRGNLSVLK